MRARAYGGWFVLVGLVGGGLVGCGARAAQPTSRVIADATAGADTAHFDTVTVESAGRPASSFRNEVVGEVDFTNGQADATPSVQPTPTTTTTTTTTTMPGESGSSIQLSVVADEPSEMRWVGGVSYEHVANTSALSRPWIAVEPSKLAAVAGCLTPADPAAAASFSSGIRTSPSDVLDALQASGAPLEPVGTDTVRGVATTHWRVPPFDPAAGSACPIRATRPAMKRSIDVWTDSDNRARRISSVTTTTWDTQTVTASTTTEFFDFGISVPTVQAPPADQVTDQTAWLAATFAGPGTVDASVWTVGAHGQIAGTPWTVYVASTSTGWRCYDASDTPQGTADAGLFSGDGNGGPVRDGHRADCVPNASTPSPGFGDAFDAFIASDDAGQRTIVGAVPGGANATVQFADGSTDALPVDPSTWIGTWTGPSDHAPIRIHAGAQACRIDGHDALSDPGFTNSGTDALANALRNGDFPCNGATLNSTTGP